MIASCDEAAEEPWDATSEIRKFQEYMITRFELSPDMAREYSSAIERCEQFARGINLHTWRLYSPDSEETRIIANILMENDEFMKYSKNNNNYQTLKAMSMLLAFIEPEKSVKVEEISTLSDDNCQTDSLDGESVLLANELYDAKNIVCEEDIRRYLGDEDASEFWYLVEHRRKKSTHWYYEKL